MPAHETFSKQHSSTVLHGTLLFVRGWDLHSTLSDMMIIISKLLFSLHRLFKSCYVSLIVFQQKSKIVLKNPCGISMWNYHIQILAENYQIELPHGNSMWYINVELIHSSFTWNYYVVISEKMFKFENWKNTFFCVKHFSTKFFYILDLQFFLTNYHMIIPRKNTMWHFHVIVPRRITT